MLGFLSLFGPTHVLGGNAGPVGVDLGTETIRLAQMAIEDGEPQLVAAASRDVPADAMGDPVAYAGFCARALKDLWREGKFHGRRAVFGLPSHLVQFLHLRLPKMDAEATRAALPAEVAGKIPFDPINAMLRHHVVGDVYTNDGPRQEVICTAARRDLIELLLGSAERARLEVVGLVAAPIAIRDCFSRIYTRPSDAETGMCFVDIGRSATRVTIARASHLYFARSIPIGGESFDKAVADSTGVDRLEAKLLRAQLAEQAAVASREPVAETSHERAAVEGRGNSRMAEADEYGGLAMLGAAMRAVRSENGAGTAQVVMATESSTSLATDLSVAAAVAPLTQRLAEELQRCRRYHEATFPGVGVERLVFVGGEANHRPICQAIAQRLHVTAQLGDPIARLTPKSKPECFDYVAAGIDRRRPQPGWAVACGLAMSAP